MSTLQGLGSGMLLASGSMNVHSTKMQVIAHNIANVNTEGFHPQRATFATGHAGVGVELESVSRVAAGLADAHGPSGTELVRELPQMIMTQRGFEANASTIHAWDTMTGYLVDMLA